mgnify:CR=1 FL=1
MVEWTFGSTTKYFDPFVYLGGTYTSVGNNSEGMINGGVGFNSWLNENIGLAFQTGTKKGFSSGVKTHFQSSLGLIFKFGGKDTDGDGIYDKDDSCPDVAGLAAFNGCPDADGDGVQDSKDSCPNVAGLAALNGCPDADGDGIADKDDMCPNEKGSSANRGCPDSDGDGVVNKDDKCPNVAGPAANGGCPWPDTDGDGLLDKDDKCPFVAGPIENEGCPEFTDEELRILKAAFENLLFDPNSAVIQQSSYESLNGLAEVMVNNEKATLYLEGHTDNVGDDDKNMTLSKDRAASVKKYLVEAGVAGNRITTAGFGETRPVASNDSSDGRRQNRRVMMELGF